MENLSRRAQILIEALPYIRTYHGKTVVVKYGGAAMTELNLREAVMLDVVLLHYVGMRPIVVHGGGPEVSEMMTKLGKEPVFVGGLRVTDEETLEIAEMVLVGKLGKEIVRLLHQHGAKAVGLSGKDGAMLLASRMRAPDGADLGLVGDVHTVNPELLQLLATNGFIPVVSSIAMGEDGATYNVNADHVAGKVAAAVGAAKLLMLTDVRGIFQDVEQPATLLPVLKRSEATAMIASGTVDKGMIPKVEACVEALAAGVERTHIIDGRIPHAVLMEVFTNEGIGTMIVAD